MNRTEEIGGAGEVLDRELEEDILGGLPFVGHRADGAVVSGAGADGTLEDGRVRSEPGNGHLLDVAGEHAGIEKIAGDVVEPDALAQVMQQVGGAHILFHSSTGLRGGGHG